MIVADAQREVRTVYRGGAIGQLVSGILWCASAATVAWKGPGAAMAVLVVGGFFIFPLTTLGLRLLGGPWKVGPGNPLNGLAMQVAFSLGPTTCRSSSCTGWRCSGASPASSSCWAWASPVSPISPWLPPPGSPEGCSWFSRESARE